MGTVVDLLNWARSQIGVTEFPPGSNRVHYWVDCGKPVFQGAPWCAAFVLAGLKLTNTQPVSGSVYVPQLVTDYRKARSLYNPADARPGDQALFNIGKGHTGIVESVDVKNHTVTSIEGNTSSGTAGSQDNGGGVYRRTRPWSQMWGVGRPVFSVAPPAPAPPNPSDVNFEDSMIQRTVTVGGLDSTGHGYTDLFDVPAGHVVSVRANTAGYAPVPSSPGDEDFAGHARIQWTGPPNAPGFSARVWVATQ